MHESLRDLSRARILVSNDDGINAPGLDVLVRIARGLSEDVWVVAPENEQSGAGHSLTLRRPLRMRKAGERRYAVDGTPTDCVLLAVNALLSDHGPDLVLSGVNRGGNLGEDVHYSGTVAAALEGTLLGVRAIALSQVFSHPDPVKWHTAERLAPDIIRKALATQWGENVLINVNFPDVEPEQVTGVRITRQGKRKIGDHLDQRIDPRGDPYIWIGGQRSEDRSSPGTDLNAVYEGAVSLTPLDVDLTHKATMDGLRKVFS